MSYYPTTKQWEDKILANVMRRMKEAPSAFPTFQGGARKQSDWLQFVKQVRASSPGMSYKDALVKASGLRRGGVALGGVALGGVSMGVAKPSKASPWLEYVKAVRAANPGLSYKDALVKASALRRGGVSMGAAKPSKASKAKAKASKAMKGGRAEYLALVKEIRGRNPQMSYNEAQKEAKKMRGGMLYASMAETNAERAAKGERTTRKARKASKARMASAMEGGSAEAMIREEIRKALSSVKGGKKKAISAKQLRAMMAAE